MPAMIHRTGSAVVARLGRNSATSGTITTGQNANSAPTKAL